MKFEQVSLPDERLARELTSRAAINTLKYARQTLLAVRPHLQNPKQLQGVRGELIIPQTPGAMHIRVSANRDLRLRPSSIRLESKMHDFYAFDKAVRQYNQGILRRNDDLLRNSEKPISDAAIMQPMNTYWSDATVISLSADTMCASSIGRPASATETAATRASSAIVSLQQIDNATAVVDTISAHYKTETLSHRVPDAHREALCDLWGVFLRSAIEISLCTSEQ